MSSVRTEEEERTNPRLDFPPALTPYVIVDGNPRSFSQTQSSNTDAGDGQESKNRDRSGPVR